MDEEDYCSALKSALASKREELVIKFSTLMEHLPAKTVDIGIGIHTGQDPDGSFTVMAHLGGPDLYALNKAVEQHRTLFEVPRNALGKPPLELPFLDSFDESFEVGDVLVDEVANWLVSVCSNVDRHGFEGPIRAYGGDAYGTKSEWILKSA
ncbi:MAG: DUF6389 family protein [Pseudomonadota bacterium]